MVPLGATVTPVAYPGGGSRQTTVPFGWPVVGYPRWYDTVRLHPNDRTERCQRSWPLCGFAEEEGFDFEVCSDHFTPWPTAQGHTPNAWAVLGAVAQATQQVDLYSYVTCTTMRYHPAVVA